MKKNHEETRGDHEETREEDLWRRTHGGEIIEASGSIRKVTGRHLVARRDPGGIQEATQEADRRYQADTQEAPCRHPGGTQEAPRRHPKRQPEASRRHPLAPRRQPGDGRNP